MQNKYRKKLFKIIDGKTDRVTFRKGSENVKSKKSPTEKTGPGNVTVHPSIDFQGKGYKATVERSNRQN